MAEFLKHFLPRPKYFGACLVGVLKNGRWSARNSLHDGLRGTVIYNDSHAFTPGQSRSQQLKPAPDSYESTVSAGGVGAIAFSTECMYTLCMQCVKTAASVDNAGFRNEVSFGLE